MGKPILNELFENKNKHIEEVPEIDKKEFIKTVKSRRSVRNFTNEPVLEKDMRACLELTVLAPNSSNLQPWEFYWVRQSKKRKINTLLFRSTCSIYSARVSGCSSSTRLLESKPKKNVNAH